MIITKYFCLIPPTKKKKKWFHHVTRHRLENLKILFIKWLLQRDFWISGRVQAIVGRSMPHTAMKLDWKHTSKYTIEIDPLLCIFNEQTRPLKLKTYFLDIVLSTGLSITVIATYRTMGRYNKNSLIYV